MILYKEIKLDLNAERRRIKKALFMVERWSKKYREFIGVEVWNVLIDIWGGEVYLTKCELRGKLNVK